MKIGIVGSFSSGKTTLANELKKHEMFKDYYFDISHERLLNKIGYSTGKKGSVEFQNTLLYKELYNLNVYKNYLTDSPLPLCQAYSDYYKRYGRDDFSEYHLLCLHIANSINKYDLLIYLGTDIDLELDNIRDNDLVFREQIDIVLRKYIKSMKCPCLYLEKDMDSRINKTIKYMEV